jgi:Leucine Rich Repeat (LRR) protein
VLSLAGNHLTDPAVLALAASPALSQLRRLDLRSNQLGDVSARALASSRHLAGLAWLEVAGNRMSAEGRTILRERFGDGVQLGAS